TERDRRVAASAGGPGAQLSTRLLEPLSGAAAQSARRHDEDALVEIGPHVRGTDGEWQGPIPAAARNPDDEQAALGRGKRNAADIADCFVRHRGDRVPLPDGPHEAGG